jgi:hypothetical protein
MLNATSVVGRERCGEVALCDWWTMNEFKIGQYVYYRRHAAEGRFVVMRLLPQPKGKVRYVIRNQDEPEREYTAEASELRRVQSGR